jgi:putative transposase
MGRGRKSLTFKLDLDFEPGGVKLVWNEGFELHIVRADVARAKETPGENRATVDLGEIHQAAVVTSTGTALVISGRGIRSHKRLLSKQLGEIARKRSRCTKGSRQSLRLQQARQKRSLLTTRRVRDLRHKGTRRVIAFCEAEKVGRLFVGDPRGVRAKDSGRRHNQRMARWEMGKDIDYLGHKAERARITCSTGGERGTSSRCPRCGNRQKVTGRVWRCKACPFSGPRDVVGGANMHPIAFGETVTFPASVTYLRPGPERAGRGVNNPAPAQATDRSSRPDTALREACSPFAPQLLGSPPPPGTTSRRPQAPAAAARPAPGGRKTQPRAA